jgi:pyruvate/oxaloacetate carboxyltransferase
MGNTLFNRALMRLGMSLIARDEVDIIAENIEYHHQKGVDTFVVLDNLNVKWNLN